MCSGKQGLEQQACCCSCFPGTARRCSLGIYFTACYIIHLCLQSLCPQDLPLQVKGALTYTPVYAQCCLLKALQMPTRRRKALTERYISNVATSSEEVIEFQNINGNIEHTKFVSSAYHVAVEIGIVNISVPLDNRSHRRSLKLLLVWVYLVLFSWFSSLQAFQFYASHQQNKINGYSIIRWTARRVLTDLYLSGSSLSTLTKHLWSTTNQRFQQAPTGHISSSKAS